MTILRFIYTRPRLLTLVRASLISNSTGPWYGFRSIFLIQIARTCEGQSSVAASAIIEYNPLHLPSGLVIAYQRSVSLLDSTLMWYLPHSPCQNWLALVKPDKPSCFVLRKGDLVELPLQTPEDGIPDWKLEDIRMLLWNLITSLVLRDVRCLFYSVKMLLVNL